MGLFGNTMGMMGGVARGTASASMWTGNMIYTALQNARTKKEIRALYKNASNANFQNRAVAVLPGVSKQQLLLMDIYAKVKYNKPWELAPVINQAFSTNSEKESA